MRSSVLWLCWLLLPVFVLTFHYGPGQIWLVRDQAAGLIHESQAISIDAMDAQEAAYQSQLVCIDARRKAFMAGVDLKIQSKHPLALSVQKTTTAQKAAYEKAADLWHQTAGRYGEATETLLKGIGNRRSGDTGLPSTDRQLLESLRWAQARALVRSGEVFNGIEQLQALLDLRTAEANQLASSVVRLRSLNATENELKEVNPSQLPIDAIREELAAAQYVGARLLREEGRPSEVWRPVSNEARQHYRYLATSGDSTSGSGRKSESSPDSLSRDELMQLNLEQVLNLEQTPSDELEGIPLPRTAPMSRRPGDGQPGNRPGNGPGRGPLRDGPPSGGAGIPQPWGDGW